MVQRNALAIEPWVKAFILTFLWITLFEDTFLFLMSWFAPDVWFRVFHSTAPTGFEITLLRRAGGQWAAFALASAITLWRWRTDSVWLAVAAGVRFSDLFTDAAYVLSAPSLTTLGRVLLLPPPWLNFLAVVIMLRGYRQMRGR